jgi:6-pyruvoyl-tetrahydropterin synthase related domain
MRRPIAPTLATLCAVGGVIAITVWALDPGLLLANNTITGGDTGAHVGLAAFMKSNLLLHGHVTGWDPGAYDGFPLNTFYFPLPDALAAFMGYIIPFNIAFKLVTILGSVTLPIAAWAFGRLAGLERPVPAVLAVATLPFLFDQTFTIYGGNLYSTLAGEYAYSLGLSVALLFLGVTLRGMRTGQMRAWGSLLLATAILCHVIAGGFAIVGAVIVFLVCGPTRRRLWWMVSVGATGVLLSAWWAVPFALEQGYSTNMGWSNITTWAALLAPGADRWALALGLVGLGFAAFRRDRAMLVLTIVGILSAVGMVEDPQGKLYDVRLLPLWWLCIYMVAGYGFARLGVGFAQGIRRLRARLMLESFAPTGSPHAVALAGAAGSVPLGFDPSLHLDPSMAWAVAAPPRPADPVVYPPPAPWSGPSSGPSSAGSSGQPPWWMPRWAPGAFGVPVVALMAGALLIIPPTLVSAGTNFSIGPVHVRPDSVRAWAQWNYTGYQGKTGWPELHTGIVGTLDRITKRYGCGRTMWEYNSDENRFGTPEALMDLPMWTGGCVDSMEGLLFESSTSTPYHFLNQAELSAAPSEAMVGLDYGPVDVPLGVQHLQLLGVKYFMAFSPEVVNQANADPYLKRIAVSGPWHTEYQGQDLATTWSFYKVNDAPLVSPLTQQPDVLEDVSATQTSWLPVAQKWYADPANFDQQYVAGGPATWTRVVAGTTVSGPALPVAHVTDVRMGTDSVSFHVDRVGVPVLVAISYFPNWHASGALGPWRAEPNLMVVDPTSHDVTLNYGTTPAGQGGLVLSVIGVACLVVMFRRRNRLTIP